MRCHNCKSIDSYRPWRGTLKLRGVRLECRGEKCRECAEILFTSDEVCRQDRLIAAAVVERGIRDGADFRYVRKVAGLRGKELAALLDVQPETLSRWESGKARVPRTAAFILGELFAHPKLARQKLEALAS